MKKIISIFLIVILLLGHTMPAVVLAEDIVTPTAPTAPTAPTEPTAPTLPIAPAQPETPTLPIAPTLPSNAPSTDSHEEESSNHQNNSAPSPTPTPAPAANSGTITTPQVGNSAIDTGDANNSGLISTTANSNLSGGGSGGSGSGLSVSNTDNGAGSTNTSGATVVNDDNTNQNNSAGVESGLTLGSDSGNNNSSGNVGDTIITTGDANVSGTIITALNTNVDGVMVSEFNVADDHVGDIVLDFAANCISGCGPGSVSAANTGNGADSTNTAGANVTNAQDTFQNNDATIGNDLILNANSGYNDTNYNTGGDSSIQTGEANVSGNVLTFANNNFAGNVVYGVVNIYGDLIGDIIFPEEQLTACCGGSVAATNSGNGADSTNTAAASQTNGTNTDQNNQANINNNLDLSSTSGDNNANLNTDGNSSIETGSTNVDANVLNVANNNLDGGNMWLVLINNAGQWFGRLIGGDGNMAASEGTLLSVGPDGQITASNGGNGAGSTNTSGASVTNNTNTTQNNTANVDNNVQLSANTGGNSTNMNTGGNNSIVTGDAQIILNMVNFVNNNIVGGGKLFVTVVNVFGSWTGDFLSPGQKKEVKTVASSGGVGGGNVQSNSNSDNSQETQNPSPVTEVLGWFTNSAKSETPKTTNTPGSLPTNQANVVSETGGKVAVDAATLKTKSNKLRINLAWLILALPFAILFILRKRLAQVANRISALL